MVHWVILNFPIWEVMYDVALLLVTVYFPYTTKVQKMLLLLASFSGSLGIVFSILGAYSKIKEETDLYLKKMLNPSMQTLQETNLIQIKRSARSHIVNINLVSQIKMNYNIDEIVELQHFIS